MQVGEKSQQLIPQPFLWRKRTAVRQELMQPRSASDRVRQCIRKRLEANMAVIADRVAEEYRSVDEGIVEGTGLALVFDERRPRDSEHLDTHAASGAKQRIGPNVRQSIREAHHRFILGGTGKYTLGILRRQATGHRNLCTKEPVTLGVRLPDSTSLGVNGRPDIILHLLKECFQIRFVIRRIDFPEICEASVSDMFR